MANEKDANRKVIDSVLRCIVYLEKILMLLMEQVKVENATYNDILEEIITKVDAIKQTVTETFKAQDYPDDPKKVTLLR
nr:5961_t:CDS:2 [Entrophospora candida]